MTKPGSSPGGRSAALAGSLPVSRQASGCPAVLAGGGRAGGGDGQQRLGAHRQHGVPVEGLSGPHLVLVQARLPLALLVAFFNRPPLMPLKRKPSLAGCLVPGR